MKLTSFLCCTLAALWFTTGGATAQSAPAVVDEQAPIVLAQSNQGGLFKSLFGKRKKKKAKRGRDVRREQKNQNRARTKQRRKKTTTAGASTASKPPVAIEKNPDALKVLVIGDFMANGLAKGLVEALASNPGIQVINASNGSSGLVRDDYYNWNTSTPELVAEHNASLVLVMVGANDRQAIRSDGKRIEVSNEAWKPAYDKRVTEFAEVLAGQGVPVLWLGLAPVSKSTLSRDYSSFNSLFRQQSEVKGFKFIDIWNGFADDKGKYVARGPDINGQTRTLRGSSGLSFTRAGRRKLAFFVERDVVKFLSDDQAALFAALPGGGAGASGGATVPAVSAMMPIESISIRPGSDLSVAPEPATADPAATPGQADNAAEPAEPLSGANTELASNTSSATDIPNRPLSSPPGRADDFSWPVQQ